MKVVGSEGVTKCKSLTFFAGFCSGDSLGLPCQRVYSIALLGATRNSFILLAHNLYPLTSFLNYEPIFTVKHHVVVINQIKEFFTLGQNNIYWQS